jgi:hypothetical protein
MTSPRRSKVSNVKRVTLYRRLRNAATDARDAPLSTIHAG